MAWSARKSLANIRRVFRTVKWKLTERVEGDTTFFNIPADGELESVQAIYQPGALSLYLVFGVRPARSRRAELIEFANRMNSMSHVGCVVIRDDGRKAKGLTVVYRSSIDHSRVKDLEEGYVASLIAELMDVVPAIDLPLVLIAKGARAETAIRKTLDGGVVPIR